MTTQYPVLNEGDAERLILAWCRTNEAKRFGCPCMREFAGKKRIVNVNAPRYYRDGSVNPHADIASGDTWVEVFRNLERRLWS